MDGLRIPFFLAAWICLIIAVLIEVGSVGFVDSTVNSDFDSLSTPGLAIAYLALFDGILLYSISLMVAAVFMPARVLGRLQGIASFVFYLLLLLAALVLVFIAITLLVMMISLLLAVPFGTAIYFGAFASFATGSAAATLGVILTLKLVFAVCLILAQQRFLTMKGLVVMVLVSLFANVLISFLHHFGPSFITSILDAVGAIVIAILAIVWGLLGLIGSIPAILKALRVDRAMA